MSYEGHHGHEDFRCQHCHQPVGAAISDEIGTRNRNHCPVCLWSVHVGQDSPKDRRSKCGAGMKPVGLTTKTNGELSLIHMCTNDGVIRTNRLALDDDTNEINKIYLESLNMLPQTRQQIAASGVKLLTHEDKDLVNNQLFGVI